MLVGVAASRTKTLRNQNHRFQSKFAYCKVFGVYAGVISEHRPLSAEEEVNMLFSRFAPYIQ